jgi:acetyl-CoA carboxylase carboxyl transferase subunit alpha
MQENAIYSVISPEGCAAILWRDAAKAKKAGRSLSARRAHCLELGVDRRDRSGAVGGAHIDPDMAARMLGQRMRESWPSSTGSRGGRSPPARARFRSLGVFA